MKIVEQWSLIKQIQILDLSTIKILIQSIKKALNKKKKSLKASLNCLTMWDNFIFVGTQIIKNFDAKIVGPFLICC